MFGSVRRMSEQVEQTRMLAERGMYLSTRLPLLGGFFADVWLSQLAFNPALQEVLGDLHAIVEVSERLATVAEQLPQQISEERNETILQLAREVAAQREKTVDDVFEGFAAERESTIEQLVAEEQRLSGVIIELRETLAAGAELTRSVDALVEKIDLGPPPEGSPPTRPFDIEDYRGALVEAGATIRDLDNLVGTTNQLLDSHGAEELIPQLVAAIEEASEESQTIVNQAFLRAALLIVIALTGYVIARLAYRSLALRKSGPQE